MSEKACAVCGRVLTPQEIRINELSSRRPASGRRRYLCTQCRKREYEEYIRSIKELI